MNQIWKTIEKKVIFDHPRKRIENWKMISHHNKELDFVIQPGKDIVIVVARTLDGEFVLIHQYYVALEKTVLSLVAGMVEEGEDPEITAQKELQEEAGYSAPTWIALGAATKGKYATGSIHYYLALDARPHEQQMLEDAEDITVELATEKNFRDYLQKGKIVEGWVQLAVYKAFEYLGNDHAHSS